LMEAPSGIEPE